MNLSKWQRSSLTMETDDFFISWNFSRRILDEFQLIGWREQMTMQVDRIFWVGKIQIRTLPNGRWIRECCK